MRKILATISSEDAEGLTEALLQTGFRVTVLSVMGGFLRRAYVTLPIGTAADSVKATLQLIRTNTPRHDIRFPLFARRDIPEVGAATLFLPGLEAMALLRFMPQRAARPVAKLVQSAVANEEEQLGVVPNELFVAQAYTDGGPRLRRYRFGAGFRLKPRIRRTSHVTVVLGIR
jgi:large subunit ribosomal protein L22